MNTLKLVGLMAVAMTALIEPVFAGIQSVPSPIAGTGIGLPVLAVIGGAYWVRRKLLARKNKK